MVKVFIVEDEAGIRESLMNAFSWSDIGCELIGAVDSGLAALEFCIHTRPDIIISDIVMPGIDGLTFLKYIKEKYASIKFILLTGHRDFNYAKDAVNLGAEFFMLKPIDHRELLFALTSLTDKIMNESEKRRDETRQIQILYHLMLGRIYRKDSIAANIRGMLDHINSFRIAVLQFDDEQNLDPFKISNLLTFCENSGLLADISAVKMDDSCLALFCPAHAEEELSDIESYLMQLQDRIDNFFHTTVSVGLSALQYGYKNLHEAYIQGLRALGKRFFSGRNSLNLFLTEEVLENDGTLTDYYFLTRFSDQIKEMLLQCQEERLAMEAPGLFRQFSASCKQNVDFLKSSFIILVVTLIRKVLGEQNKRYIFFYEKHSNFQRVIRCGSVDDLEHLFVDIVMDLHSYTDSKNGNHQSIISRVQQYIEEHFHENVSLNEVAKKVFLSPAYLSSLITSETGKNFVDILNEVRISQAIELLKKPQMKISEIAYSVGFNEPQYFTLTFKKYTGQTPRNYRELYLKKE